MPVRSSRFFGGSPPQTLIPWTLGAAALTVGLWLGSAWGSARLAQADSGSLPESVVKSAYLYQFTHFVEWPGEAFDGSEAPVVICVLGEDPFGPALDTLTKKTSQNRRLVVQRFKRIQDLDACHVLFMSASEQPRTAQVLSTLALRHVLTVSDVEGFAQAGGVIEFVHEENRIRFAVNVGAAKKAGLRISSKLLSLAMIVDQP